MVFQINFNALNNQSQNNIIDPIDIFNSLPKRDRKYNGYLRDVQSQVLKKWFNSFRDNTDCVIKMNTGSGKTVVGLLILKSCLNEKKGPAVYIVPDKYLLTQVINEANALGIKTTENHSDLSFIKGESILVINIYKFFNGLSVFGVNNIDINIGSIVIDDAHACINIVESQSTLKIDKTNTIYSDIFNIFKDELKSQSNAKTIEIESGDPNAFLQVPFWAWKKHSERVLNIIYNNRDSDEDIKFRWPILNSIFDTCNCIIGSKFIEISPKFFPIHVFPSFDVAKRRIFMSATISDDSILVSHFNLLSLLNKNATSITPDSADDIGERMIIIPQEIDPNITDDELKNFYVTLSKKENILIIVPTTSRSKYWEDVANEILDTENIHEGISKIKSKHVGITVLINKYDGIDLANNSCNVLVIDGLPTFKRKIDQLEESRLRGSQSNLNNLIQKIEQGMGRCVRSKDDHCVIFLMGNSLVKYLYIDNALDKFTPATQKQLELSSNLAKQLEGGGLEAIQSATEISLSNNNVDWIQSAKNALIGVKPNDIFSFDQRIISERKAFNSAIKRDFNSAINTIQDAVNKENNLITKGVLKQKLAEYTEFINSAEAQQILLSATKDNSQVLHPIAGIQYTKLIQSKTNSQASEILDYIDNKFKTALNDFIIYTNGLIDLLKFETDTADTFEQAITDLAFCLGFIGQRPEKEYRSGPDNLLRVKNLTYFVIECKNGAETSTISKSDCNQLNGSIQWFYNTYGNDISMFPIMIHPSNIFDSNASPNDKIRILSTDCMDKLKKNLKEFFSSVVSDLSISNIDRLLKHYNLSPDKFISNYTVKYTMKKQ